MYNLEGFIFMFKLRYYQQILSYCSWKFSKCLKFLSHISLDKESLFYQDNMSFFIFAVLLFANKYAENARLRFLVLLLNISSLFQRHD